MFEFAVVDDEVELFPDALPADPPVLVTVTVTVSVTGVLLIAGVDGVKIFSAKAYTPAAPAIPITPMIATLLTNSRLSNRLFHSRFTLGNRNRGLFPSSHLLHLIPYVRDQND